MGAIRIKTLEDIERVNGHVGIECHACGHKVVMERGGIIQWFRFKKWNTALEAAATRFRCRCGARNPRLFASVANPPQPPPRPVIIWEREVKDEIRRRRG